MGKVAGFSGSVVAALGMFIATAGQAAPTDPSPSPKAPSETRPRDSLSVNSCGVGACKRSAPPGRACVPGKPLKDDDGWLSKKDEATDSWDANCDGQVEKRQYEEAYYLAECAMQKGVCKRRDMRGAECGVQWHIFSGGCTVKTEGNVAKCVFAPGGGDLKGEIRQQCR